MYEWGRSKTKRTVWLEIGKEVGSKASSEVNTTEVSCDLFDTRETEVCRHSPMIGRTAARSETGDKIIWESNATFATVAELLIS